MVEASDETSNKVLENKDNDFKIKIAKNIKNKRLVVIRKDKYEISWGINKAAASMAVVKEPAALRSKKRQDKVIDIRTQNLQKQTVENLSSAVEFSDVYPNIDLQYNISSEMLKENFIIKNKVNNPILTFNLEVKNLIPVIQQDNSIIFYDDQNTSEVIFKIDPPNMYDSTMSSSKNIKMTLNQQNKNYILTLIPDNSWINDTQRLYPIIIDPTIKTAQETNSIVDSYVSLNYPTTNYKNETILKVGNGNTTGITRSFIKFSLPTDKLKAGDLVIGARLNLKMALDNYDKRQINVYKVTQDWSSGSITWANSPSVEEGKIQDYQVINGALGSWVSWDITKLVKEWISTGINYGVTLRNSNESVGYNQFYSSDVSDYDEAGNNISVVRPVITIDYINNSGLENYWTYHSQDVGRAGSGYVNDFNGNLVFIHNDLAMTGSKMPLAINHVFNSNDRAVNLGYGYGWRLNLNQRIEADSIGDMQYYIYTDEDGTKHYFYYDNSSETYQQQMGVDLTFNKNSDGSYTITDKEGGRLEFVVGGYLYKIKDKNDNTITLSYDGTVLKSITDGAGRVTKLDVLSNGYLVGIIDPGGQRTSFAYNGQQLSQITYPDGKYTLFTYDSKNNLQNAKNYDSYNINYDYYPQSPYRVKTIKEFGTDGSLGGSLDIKYGYNTTTFTDMNKPDRINIYQFNDYGMTISIKNSDESAEIYKYNNEKKNLYNKLSAASRMQKFSKNYLKNHGAESEELYWTKGNWMGIEPKNIDGKFTTEEAYMGQKSLKMTKSDESSRDFYQQWVTGLEIGKAYVFSAYIKTVGITKLNNKGAALFITYKDSSGVYNSFESTCIQGTNDWVRHDFSFTLPSNADTSSVAASVGIIQEKGTAYFDCMQLEEGNIPSRYNLVENADFSYSTTDPSPWIKGSETDTNDVVSPNSGGKSAYKIAGVVGKKKNVYQKLYISGKAGDGFIVSAWAMANLAAPSDSSASNESARLFALGVGFQTSATENDWFVVPFNEDVDTWQYVSDIIVAKKDYTQITIYGEYYNNINNAYFTDFQLYKEEYGASYEYDDKGNVKAIQSLAKERSSFVYDNTNNTLTSATMPNNGTYEYKYDTKRNLTKATSATKVLYSFDYDSSGNPLKSRVGDPSDVNVGDTARLFMESTGNYSTSGNYLKAQIDNEENSVISHYNEGKGILAAITDGKGSKTFHNYDDMNRLTSVYKILGDSGNRNLEKFPLSTSLVGSKGTRTIFDAGINLLENSSFENGTNPIPWKVEDWNGSTGKWRVVSGGVNGNYCLESYDSDGVITGQATNAVAYQLVTLSAALAVNKIYTLSTYSKRTGSANPALAIQCFDINGAQIAGSYQNNVNTIPLSQWTRISNSFNVPAGTKSFFVILRSSVSGTDTISFDAVQMEENNAATTYSLSRSDNSKPYYDLGIDKKSGTMSIWFNTTGTGTRMIFSNENSLTLFNLYIDSQNKVILNAINKAGTAQNIITVGDMTIANSTWYFIALRWQLIKSGFTSTLQCTLYVNNKAYNGSVTDFRDFTGLVTALGSNQSGNYSLSGTLDNFAYSRNALSNEDINLLYNKTMPDDKGTVVTNSYSYENDRIKKVTHNGFSYNFEYDNFGNNNKVYVENQLLITNKFDPATDNLMSSEYGNNQRISMTYDEFDRITERKFNKDTTDGTQTDVSRYTYAYNNEGNLAYHEDKVNNKNYKYTYDLSDRLVKVDEINNEIGSANYGKISSTKFGYDMSNNGSIMMEKIDEKLYETRYGYDKDNRATGVFYDPVVEDISSFEYFHLTENTIGSKGKVPETETPVFRNDENYEPALYAYPGTKVVYDLGINKNYGTMTAWVNTRNNTGSRMIIGNEGTGKLFNLYIDGNQKVNLAVINNNGSFTNLTTSDEALRYNTWYFVAMSWQFYPDSSTLDCTLYVNDRIYKFKTADFKDFTGLKTSIGSNISGDYSLNGLIRNFNYSSSTLTEGEILSMYTNKSIRYSYDKLGRLEKK
uniref:DNRLRE domain-containing protein n=1 Tax=Clostridium thailandense TaxID=2794346 RepID=UPI00398992A9